jgi:hypothetical protein
MSNRLVSVSFQTRPPFGAPRTLSFFCFFVTLALLDDETPMVSLCSSSIAAMATSRLLFLSIIDDGFNARDNNNGFSVSFVSIASVDAADALLSFRSATNDGSTPMVPVVPLALLDLRNSPPIRLPYCMIFIPLHYKHYQLYVP